MRTLLRFLGLLAAITLVAAACSSSDGSDTATKADVESAAEGDNPSGAGEDPTPEEVDEVVPQVVTPAVYPGTEWERISPDEAGFEEAGLQEVADHVEPLGTNCVAIVKDGRLVYENYWNGTDADTNQEIFSASKSVSSTLVGIAQDQGLLSIDEPASTYLDEWVGTDSETVTIRNLVSNDSGRFWDFQTDYPDMGSSDDRTSFAIALDQQSEPGTEWIYNNAAIQTLEGVLERATGQPVVDFAEENLFAPIGMTSGFVTDAAGNPPTYMGVQAGCLDLARFGLLFQAGGNWDGTQVVSEEWVTEATSPSTDLNAAYGFLWWLNADGGWQHPAAEGFGEGPFWDQAPLDAYAALGLGDQIALVIPSEGLVITRVGGLGGDQGDGLVNDLAGLVMAAKSQ